MNINQTINSFFSQVLADLSTGVAVDVSTVVFALIALCLLIFGILLIRDILLDFRNSGDGHDI